MNNEQWGNIELPGFDDTKLLDPNVNKKIAAMDPERREKMGRPHRGKPSNLKGKQQAEEHIAKRLTTRSANGFVPDITGIQQANQTRARPVKDDQGNVYASLAESARAHNIAIGTAQYRIRKGYWSYVAK
jgi:hypothetical protein